MSVVYLRGTLNETGLLWRALLLGLTFVLCSPQASALDPNQPLLQLYHSSWGAREGITGGVTALAQTKDGYLWVGTTDGLFRFDGLYFDPYRPEAGALPATSVSARQAFYTNLGPGSYTFHVIASNNDGVWNEAGASIGFTVAPAWYQTAWFRAFCLVSVLFVVWGVYRIRVRQVAAAIGARFDERLTERIRLAQELHDTFLQTVQGSKMVADDALEMPPDPERMRRAIQQLSVWLGQATQEGRAALNSLRSSTIERNDLAEALRRATQNGLLPNSMAVNFSVVGNARDMHPIVRDEVYRIGYETIRNACAHSGASQLTVELRYERDLVVRVKDDGKGIPPAVVAGGKGGHFGLQGMRERAGRIGAKLTLDSSATSGTDVTLVVPGAVVFRNEGVTRFAPLRGVLRRISRTNDPR